MTIFDVLFHVLVLIVDHECASFLTDIWDGDKGDIYCDALSFSVITACGECELLDVGDNLTKDLPARISWLLFPTLL